MKSEPNLQEQVEKAVLKGAAWLDENEPGWYRKINIHELEMEQPCYCVLGQLYAGQVGRDDDNSASGFHWANKKYNTDGSGEFAMDNGFDVSTDNEDEYQMLDQAWYMLITERNMLKDYEENAN